MSAPDRQTVDLSAYPDMVVIYLGMRVNALQGIKTVLKLGPQIRQSVAGEPDGLLLHEDLLYSLRHIGMRQYWRDFDSLERFSRAEPHIKWWREFVRDTKGTGFWHEAYFMGGGMEAVYDSMPKPLGMSQFAPVVPAQGAMFSARKRAAKLKEPALVGESDLDGG
jgi:fumigallin biosynthesis monooxygenase-like protein